MKLKLNIEYKSKWGQNLFVSGNIPEFGNWQIDKALEMHYFENDIWILETKLPDVCHVEYKYFIREPNGFINWEGGKNHVLDKIRQHKVVVDDRWRLGYNVQDVLNTKVFTDVIMKPQKVYKQKNVTKSDDIVRFTIKAPRVGKGFGMAVIGDQDVLGNWGKPQLMSNENYPLWVLDVDRDTLSQHFSYKYVIVNLNTKEIATWENRKNRELTLNTKDFGNHLEIIHDIEFQYPVGNWKGAGVAIPVFSLRSEDGFGVGEFNDIKKLVDWCVKVGLKIIQILPINETVATHSWLDSYPYKSISVTALHPMYLNLSKMGVLKNKRLAAEFDDLKIKLNSLTTVDYVDMFRAKSRYFKLIFDQNWNRVKGQKDYLDFFNTNKEWLQPYASFCYLRDKFGTSDFHEWGKYAEYTPQKIEKLTNPNNSFHEDIAIHYFIQYHLDKQLREVVDYAHSKGIGLKGDIPIGVSRNSIEAWSESKLFNLNAQAGAPPDDFAIMGQNWGFPTYNWDEMALDNYAWWRKRLKMMEKYFDAYRIDHILGFFRIWEIPKHSVQGLLGYFKPGLPMTPEEIESNGLVFHTNRFVKPYIRSHFLPDFFRAYTDEVRQKYLNETELNIFELKPEFDTQRKIFDFFTKKDQEISTKDLVIRDGLMALLNEVIFIKDPYQPNAYHPRICVHYTQSYKELDNYQKDKLNNIYIHFYYHRHNEFWKMQALNKLPKIVQASNMLICGEDLGMVPSCVPEVMLNLNILTLEVQRMPKKSEFEFAHPNDAPYMSVATTSTHDMSTIRGWWEENREKTNRFYRHILGHHDNAPFFAEPWICQEIIKQHLFSPSMWTIFPIQDLIAMDGELRWKETDKERINLPSNPENQWRYRMIRSLDELIHADAFNELLKTMIQISGRNAAY